MENILIIGANGQLGLELTESLCEVYGRDKIFGGDIKEPTSYSNNFITLDVLDKSQLLNVVRSNKIKQVYILAAILSAKGEDNPQLAWELNVNGLLNVLELARQGIIKKIFWPSSIAVFGSFSPKENTPQETIMNPNTVYGISKLAGERWCSYYFDKYNVDVRSIRYPGLVGYKSMPGGGTTDYAVSIFHKALKNEVFNCYLSENIRLPMMYMADAIEATVKLMKAPKVTVSVRSSYNVSAMSFSPKELYEVIKTHIPEFAIIYNPDYRNDIARCWPSSIDDTKAREDWGWHHKFGLEQMVITMLKNLKEHKP